MAGLPMRAGKLSSVQLPSPPAQGFPGPSQPGTRIPVLGQVPSGFLNKQPYQDSTSPEGYDTDMADAAGSSSAAVSNAASPEEGNNEDGIKAKEKGAKAKTKMAAIPEYFASKKTKDGKVPKKRGPKPDSKPARDRRQELNRQAQRNHRHRKEEQQKWLEEALTEAHDKARAAMKRAQEAEELHRLVARSSEHLQRENERLKQLLDVNKIPFQHVIPQPGPLGIEIPQQTVAIRQHSGLAGRSTAPQSTSSTVFATTPRTRPTITPIGTATASSTGPPSVQSNSTGGPLNGTKPRSSASPISPMDGAHESNALGSGPQMYGYGPTSSGQQPILQIGSTSDALTGQPSGAITGESSAAASMPCSSVASNYSAPLEAPHYPQSSTQPLGHTYPGPSVNVNPTFPQAIGGTHVEGQQADPFAITDHDQIGVEFILALEANCHDHKTLMNARTFNDPVQLGGHSLMLTKVPINVAKSYRMGDAPYPHQLPDVGEGPGKYARLLSLVSLEPYSTNKNWASQSGEITPAQALGLIRKDPRYPMLNSNDFAKITNVLKDRCRCYGFGAVVEVYEVQDALDDVFGEKGFGLDNGYDLNNPFWSQVPLSNPHTLNGPEFPALDGLMDFEIAGLLSNRHSDREQFLAADLSSFNLSSADAQNLVGNHQSHHTQASSVISQTSNSAGFSQGAAFNVEPATAVHQAFRGPNSSATSGNYHGISPEYSAFPAQHARER